MTDKELYAECHRLFIYEEGKLYYKIGNQKSHKGSKVGFVNRGGYLRCMINKKQHSVHRLIFLMHHKYLPPVVDHIDRNTVNNTINNLRKCSRSGNSSNRTSRKGSQSKYLGVRLTGSGKWQANIQSKEIGKLYLGSYASEVSAAEAYNEAAKKYHGEFANLNDVPNNN